MEYYSQRAGSGGAALEHSPSHSWFSPFHAVVSQSAGSGQVCVFEEGSMLLFLQGADQGS